MVPAQYFNNNRHFQRMSSIKEKLKSKIKGKQDQPETMESFDQNAVTVSLSQGKTQLSEVRVQCVWSNKSNMKIPRLQCRWYNRTENNLQEITGVQDEQYQPSILDVGSIIEITCLPDLPGISYEGMPIQLKSAPITLAPETESQATHLAESGKGKFFIELKEARIKGRSIAHGCESLIKFDGLRLILCQMKFGQLNDDVLKEIVVDELYPQLVPNRRASRELTLKFSEEESCLINFKNHEVRDIFCLLNKLMIAKIAVKKAQMTAEKPVSHPPVHSQVKQQEKKLEEPTVKEQVKIQQAKPQAADIPKQSTVDLLQLSNLKQELKLLEVANTKLAKQLQLQKDKNYNLEVKVSQTTERLQSASNNYFTLEKQLTLATAQIASLKQELASQASIENNRDEELLYYKNQIKILSALKAKMTENITELTNHNQTLSSQLLNFQKLLGSQGDKSFQELQEELRSMKEMNRQLKLRYQYELQEKEKIEEDLKNSRNLMEQIQAEKKYIERKYESLSNQLSSPSLAMSKLSDSKSNGERDSLSSSYVFDDSPSLDRRQSSATVSSHGFPHQLQAKDREISDLRRHNKDLVQQNSYLRSLLSKEKKSSSKTQLKLQLFEVKKLVNKLSEAMMEKDMAIANLKEINRELNRRKGELQAQLKV